jgi:ankyrin repeat protein
MMQRRGFLRLTSRTILAAIFVAAFPGAAAMAADSKQVSDFFRAASMDDAATVKSLIAAGVDPNMRNPVGGEPALVLAAREGSMRVLQVLLDSPGIQIDATAMNGNTALMMAAFKRNRAAAEALVARGATVNRTGWTPLHYAAASGDEDIAKLLIKRGAKLDAVSPPASGAYTPLMMVDFLTRQGANPKLTNTEGMTAAQIAARASQAR